MCSQNTQSPLYNKSVTFNGDSICNGAAGAGGYGKMIADKYYMNYENVAVNGATITAGLFHNDGRARHCISRTIDKMNPDADYIILEGGVNDASLPIPLGKLTPGYNDTYDDTTFIGAMESMFFKAYARFPHKKIGYIAAHKMTDRFNANNKENSFYYAALEVCRKWGIPVCDLNIATPPFRYIEEGSPLYPIRQVNCPDGWHPTLDGYRNYYADKIAAWMETL